MKVSFNTPPNWETVSKKFDLKSDDKIFYTYGDCIYSPAKIIPTDDLIRHEETHGDQQEHNEESAKIWWEKYLHDPDFRVAQETEAYGAQYRFICEKYKQRDIRAKYMHHFAKSLSGPIYGHCISYSEATKQIREFSEYGRGKLSTGKD